MVRPLTLLLALALTGSALVGCSGGEERLTVYSGRTEELVGPLLVRFSEETGVPIDVRYGDSAELALLISEEGDKTPADVFISQSPGAVGFLANEGRLAEVDAAVLDLVDPAYRSADGTWVGLSGRQRVLVFNPELVDAAQLPDSVLDLTNQQYAGEVAVAPTNGSFQDFVTAMRQARGDEATLEWLEGMAANDAPTYANNTAIVEAVGRGEVPMGLVNHYYNLRVLEEDPGASSANHYFAADDAGSLVIVTTAAVLDASEQPDNASELVRFLVGEEAQTFFSEETYEYPLAAGIEPALELPPLAGTATEIDFDALGGDLEGTVQLIDQSGLKG